MIFLFKKNTQKEFLKAHDFTYKMTKIILMLEVKNINFKFTSTFGLQSRDYRQEIFLLLFSDDGQVFSGQKY